MFHRYCPIIFTSSGAATAKSLQSCPTLRPYRRQPTRLPRPGDSPGKNTGVGCYFLLQCLKVKSESEVTHLCPTLCDPKDYSLPGSSVHGIFQQEYWSELPFLPPGNILNPGIKPESPVAPALQADSLPLSHQKSPLPQFN